MKILLHPRGTTAESDAYTGPASQLTIDTERWEIRLHDDETPGGHRILNLEQLLLLFMSIDSEFGDVEFEPGDRGFLVRTGDRVYALRQFLEGNGIEITNPAGTAGDVTIAISADYLNGLSLTANSIPFVVTTGAANAFLVDVPASWPNTDGAVLGIQFHLAPTDGATLSPDGAAPLPILSADGSNDVHRVAIAGTVGIIMKVGDFYRLIGHITPSTMGILPIDGIAATNVQDALEELKAEIDAITGAEAPANPNSPRRYPAGASQNGGGGGIADVSINVPLAEGEFRRISAGGQGVALDTVTQKVLVNGVQVLERSGGVRYSAIVHRFEDKLYIGDILAESLNDGFITQSQVVAMSTTSGWEILTNFAFSSNYAGANFVLSCNDAVNPTVAYSAAGVEFPG